MLKINEIISDGTLNINTDIISDKAWEFTNAISPPHCSATPEYGNDLTNKLYVDSRIASGGNNFLYFNYSLTTNTNILPYKELGNSINIASLTTITTPQLNGHLIASFMTNTDLPYITQIPAGIWELNQYGMTDGAHNGTLYYYFMLKLYKPSTNTYRTLGVSGNTSTVDAVGVPALYFATLPLPTTVCELEERIVIEVYSQGTLTGSGHDFYSYYQGQYYSYITCPLLTGTNLLNLNNTWTGGNTFSQAIVIPNSAFSSTTTAVNGNYLTSNYVNIANTQSITGTKTFSQIISNTINWNAINGTINLYDSLTNATINLGKNIVSGSITIGNVSTNASVVCAGIVMKALDVGSSGLNVDLQLGGNLVGGTGGVAGNILMGNNQTSGYIAIGNAGARQSGVFIGSGLNSSANIDIGANTGVSAISIGSASKIVYMRGSSVYLTGGVIESNVFPTVTAVMPSETSATSALSSNQWVQSVITYLKTTLVNTWTQIQTFTVFPVCLATDPIATDSGSTLCTNKWVQTVITYLKAIGTSNTWAGPQTFSSTVTNFNLLQTNGNQLNSIDGALNMNIGQSSSSGNINIGNAQTSGLIQIGNNGSRLGASAISIGSGALSQSPINIGSSTGSATITIGSASKVVNITSSAITLTGATTLTNTLTLGTVAPTLSTQLGWSVLSTTLIAPATISNVAVNIAQLTLPTSGGVYLLSAGMNFTGVGTGVNISYSVIGNIMQTVGNPVGSYAGITLPTLAYTSTSTNQIIYLRAQNNGLANTAQTVMFSAIRIA